MRIVGLRSSCLFLVAVGALGGCGGDGAGGDATPPPRPAVQRDSYPDPPPAVADRITGLIRDWVAERAGEDGVFDIPPRGGQDVSGTLAEFHTVHQKDADTYTVCVDFVDGDSVYDVDVFVDRSADGLEVRDVFLHKIDGTVVSG